MVGKENTVKKYIFWVLSGMVFTLFLTLLSPVESGRGAYVVQCKAATRTLTVKKADTVTAEKIHACLTKGKAVTLRLKGSKTKVKKAVSTLQSKIKKINKQGVIFTYYLAKKSGDRYVCKITKDHARYYQYSVKFVKKLWGIAKKNIVDNTVYSDYLHDSKLYPDETTRKMRQIYDFLVDYYTYGKVPLMGEKAVGYDEATTITHVYFSGVEYAKLEEFAGKYVLDSITTDTSTSKTYTVYHIYSFEEFSKKYTLKELTKHISIDTPTSSDALIANTKNFCDLSSAVKVAAISESGYFYCRKKRSDYGGYGMLYSSKRILGTGLKITKKNIKRKSFLNEMQARWNMTTMKKMYKNKVQGVCATFATAEGCLFDALGIKSEVGTGYNHAWRIVRVKNSDKKVMYVTFDYTLGFRTVRGNEAYEKLSAAKKYQTIIRAYFIKHPKEKMPKKQNFVYSTDIY